jgi:predicted nucleotidyltransferase
MTVTAIDTMPVEIQKELESMTNTIVGMIPEAAVILFGSYSRGEQRPYSDLDICVVTPKLKKRSLEMIDEIRLALINRSLPLDVTVYTIDEFMDESKKKSLLAYEILKEGVILNG